MSFNLLSNLSHVAIVIGKVKNMLKAISTFGYSARKEYVVINWSKAKVVRPLKSGKRKNAGDLKYFISEKS